jgi:hypothetical protein
MDEILGTHSPAELHEAARGEGAQKTIGELVTCPFCTGVWVATGLTGGLIYLPRTTRLVMGTVAALAGADLLQFGHAWCSARWADRRAADQALTAGGARSAADVLPSWCSVVRAGGVVGELDRST